MLRWTLWGVITSLLLLSQASAQKAAFTGVREKVEAKDFVGAQTLLKGVKQALTPIQAGQKSFTEGVMAFELEKYDEAIKKLHKALSFPGPLEYYIRYYLGRVLQEKKQYKKAHKEYNRALQLRPPRHLTYMTKFHISRMSIDRKWWNTAYKELKYLERRWRRDKNYPEVLWRLVQVEMKRSRKWRACRWARKLYSKYPSHALVYDWGIDLPSAPFKGRKLGCLASTSDQKKRIRRLQWAGESDRARKEIDTLRARAKGGPAIYMVDKMFASFLINEGYVNEALTVLLKHYDKKKRTFDYLKLLGKAASRAGEYQTAVGAYNQAHQTSPKSRAGREALFQAAFLSYQFQDYDGAARKFERFIKKYPRSGLSRDSHWHLAWIRYLKGDYHGAIAGFDKILDKKKLRRTRRRWRKYSTEKINYWKAMALLRLEKFDEARKTFESITKDNLIDYYTLAAKFRVETIPGLEKNRQLASAGEKPATPNGGLSAEEIEAKENGATVNGETNGKAVSAQSEEEESEDNLLITSDQEEGDQEEASADGPEVGKADDPDDKKVTATDFKDPELRLRFERASLLIEMGLVDWAKWELYEIERRTRNQDYLKMLMTSYEQMRSYHRSSYIGIVYFSRPRAQYGMDGVRYLWEHAYPRAYKGAVDKYSADFNVPKEFIWGIMRAESSFRYDIVSPVGAKGLMQLMPNTARQVARLMGDSTFNDRDMVVPEVNIRIGSRYLNRLLRKFDGMVPLAAAGYNAGPHRVESWLASFGKLDMDEFIEHIPFIETRNYVKKVVRNFGIYNRLYNKPEPTLSWLTQPIKVQITRPSPRETWEAL